MSGTLRKEHCQAPRMGNDGNQHGRHGGGLLAPDPGEVESVFEVPLAFLLDQRNHQRHSREFQGRTVGYYAMPYGDRYIWGATAGMLVNLCRVLAD